MTDSNAGTPHDATLRAPGRFRAAWRVLQAVLVLGLFAYSYVRDRDPEVRERNAMARGTAEQLQTLKSGDDTYSLHYFGGNADVSVYKNEKRVFDSREADTLGCIRLRRRDDGVVELECQHANRRDAIFFPMP